MEVSGPLGGNVETNLDFSYRQRGYDEILYSDHKMVSKSSCRAQATVRKVSNNGVPQLWTAEASKRDPAKLN